MPTLSASYNVNSASVNTATLTTPSFTPNTGDVIIVKGVTYAAATILNTPTDTQGNTYTQRVVSAVANRTWNAIWTTTAGSGASMTVSASVPNSCDHSITVERWTAAALDATPATSSANGSGSPSSLITTSQPYSAVTWCNGDGGLGTGQDPAGRTYDTTSATPIEDGLHFGAYTAYYATQSATSAGSQVIGITAPTGQSWTLIAMEVLDIGAAASVDQFQFGTLAWQ